MECITYTLDFHGRLSSVRPGVYELDAIGDEGAVLLTELSMSARSRPDTSARRPRPVSARAARSAASTRARACSRAHAACSRRTS